LGGADAPLELLPDVPPAVLELLPLEPAVDPELPLLVPAAEPVAPPDLLVTAFPPPLQLFCPEQLDELDELPPPGGEFPPDLLVTALPPPVQLDCPEQLPPAGASVRGFGAPPCGLMSLTPCGFG
jgi:hypothetical protein